MVWESSLQSGVYNYFVEHFCSNNHENYIYVGLLEVDNAISMSKISLETELETKNLHRKKYDI